MTPERYSRPLRLALDWVAVELLDPRCDGSAAAAGLADLLVRHGVADRRLAERAVAGHAAREGRGEGPSGLDGLEHLARAVFTLADGLPALLPGRLGRGLIRAIDPDGLACMHPGLRLPADEPYDWSTVPPIAGVDPLRQISGGTVDTHVHLGGILPPSYFWIAFCGGQLPLTALDGIQSVRARYADRRAWIAAVGGAAADRLALAGALQERGRVFRAAPPGDDPRWDAFLARLETTAGPTPSRRRVLELSWELRRGQRLEHAFVDPLRGWREAHFAAGERRLLVGIARHLRRAVSDRRRSRAERARVEGVAATLRRYLRVRNAFHQVLVQLRGAGGLAEFFDFFRRRRALTPTPRQKRRRRRLVARFQRSRMAAAVSSQLVGAFPGDAAGGPTRDLEIRTHPPTGRHALRVMRAWMLGIGDAARGDPGAAAERQRVGLIMHVGRSARADLAVSRARLGLRSMKALLAAHPGLRRVVVGVDVTGDERNQPPRTLAPVLGLARDKVRAHRARSGRPRLRMGWTYHVGEDAWDLLSGLRHVDEVASHVLPAAGGRLGHGLALCDPPRRFYGARDGFTEPTLGAHLLDLVWAWGRLRAAPHPAHGALVRFVEERLAGLLGGLDGDRLTACWQAMAFGRRGDEPDRKLASEAELLGALAEDPGLGEGVVVEGLAPEWLRLIERLQAVSRARLSRRPITVEINPTSNVIIGAFGDYRHLPYDALVDAELPVSINTDDPGLFLTNLSHEYLHLYTARMLDPDMTHDRAMAWLRARLRDGLESRFIRPDTPTRRALMADMARTTPQVLLYDPP